MASWQTSWLQLTMDSTVYKGDDHVSIIREENARSVYQPGDGGEVGGIAGGGVGHHNLPLWWPPS